MNESLQGWFILFKAFQDFTVGNQGGIGCKEYRERDSKKSGGEEKKMGRGAVQYRRLHAHRVLGRDLAKYNVYRVVEFAAGTNVCTFHQP